MQSPDAIQVTPDILSRKGYVNFDHIDMQRIYSPIVWEDPKIWGLRDAISVLLKQPGKIIQPRLF
jgi:hypothetical protein